MAPTHVLAVLLWLAAARRALPPNPATEEDARRARVPPEPQIRQDLVSIITRSECQYCDMARDWLRKQDIDFEEHNVDESPHDVIRQNLMRHPARDYPIAFLNGRDIGSYEEMQKNQDLMDLGMRNRSRRSEKLRGRGAAY